MRAGLLTFVTALSLGFISAIAALPKWAEIPPDADLARVIRAYGLRPLATKPLIATPKYLLGQALFFDPVLSGARDISCATCHLASQGTSDGLALSIGTGGDGSGPDRSQDDGASLRRNALDLWNRDNNAVASLFWDGRVEALAPGGGSFRSPLGQDLPAGLENTLAVQALFPLIEPEEMLGKPADVSASYLPDPHRARPNEIAQALEENGGLAVYDALLDRLIAPGNAEPVPWQATYRTLVEEAYPATPLQDITIAHLANAIAHFEELAFATRETPWDRYLAGDLGALTFDQKRGALLFFGKGRCGACHGGPMLSDFDFHSVGVPSTDGGEPDLGRYEVTGLERDRHLFRTPPLRNVALTAPYFHNGSVDTLTSVILQHLDPLRAAHGYTLSGEHRLSLTEIAAISPLLREGTRLRSEEIEQLVAFLRALSMTSDLSPEIVPNSVPSGLAFDR